MTTTEEFVACFTITAGNDFVVGPSGDVTFLTGESVAAQEGFSVQIGAAFRMRVDPSLTEF